MEEIRVEDLQLEEVEILDEVIELEPIVAPVEPKIEPKEILFIGTNYTNGQKIPSCQRNKVHAVREIRGEKTMLETLPFWVYTKDCK